MALDPRYLSGIGVGLLIAWVTSAIAYYKVNQFKGDQLLYQLILLELVLSAIFFLASYLVRS